MTDSILLFAGAIKRATHRKSLFGTFNGYLLNTVYLADGYACVEDLINSPDIDFIAGSETSRYEGPGRATFDRSMTESVKRHHKL